MKKIPIKSVEDFKVYQKAVRLFTDFLEKDLPLLRNSFAGRTLAGNQLRSLDSICANMEEGYGRKAGKELKHFFRISRGSANESKGRYSRCKKLLPKKIIDDRLERLDEILAMLYSLINKLRD